MKFLMTVLPLAVLAGCSDKEEDTAADSAVEDTDTAEDTAAEGDE